MNIDLHTLIVALVVTNVFEAVVISFQYLENRTYRGIGWWALGFAANALGFLLLLLRDYIAIDLISIVLANTTLVSGAIFIYIGVLRFLDKKEHLRLIISIISVFIVSFCYFTFANDDITIRSLIVSIAIAAVLFFTARELLVNKTQSITASANFVSAILLAISVFLVFRAIVLLIYAPVDSIFTPTLLQTSVFLGQLVGILLTFGLIIMVNQRLKMELMTNINQRKKMEQMLEEMATHDFLTGLPNRVLLADRFTIAAALANRNKSNLSVMSLDLDNFKAINDSLGHEAGDKVLQAASTRLTKIVRASDTVARVGGDEFILIMPEIRQRKDAAAMAQKVLDCFKEPLSFNGHSIQLSTSIGIAIYPEDANDMETLIKKSDVALYWSKSHGRNQYKFFIDDLSSHSDSHRTPEK
jgi:diguanylate cyclase (GGDEF)-like protein